MKIEIKAPELRNMLATADAPMKTETLPAVLSHTPGPWVLEINKDGGDWQYNIRTEKPHNPAGTIGKHIATANQYMRSECGNHLVVEHNARLIAAAPDLLAACNLMMEAQAMQQGKRDGGTMGFISIAIDAARAAIAKATTL